MMDAVTAAITPFYPGYERCFGITKVTGTWRPLPGSHPYKGEIGKIESTAEIKLDFIVRGSELEQAIEAIVAVHPYEEPAIDIIPCIGWRSVLQRSLPTGR
jgi:hypothetical protein